MKTLHLLFNHKLTSEQKADAQKYWDVERFLPLPDDLQQLWSAVPPSLESLTDYLQAICQYLGDAAKSGDVVLIQGDYGATYHLVRFALAQGFLPVYSTTERNTQEVKQPDGSIKVERTIRHKRFRLYA